jgi:hypothetical protein
MAYAWRTAEDSWAFPQAVAPSSRFLHTHLVRVAHVRGARRVLPPILVAREPNGGKLLGAWL